MARDYKNRGGERKKQHDQGHMSGLLVFAAGLVTGLCVAAMLYLLEALPDLRQTAPALAVAPLAPEPPAKTVTEEDPRRPAPRFDFYTILPEMEVSIPEWETPPMETLPETTAAAEPPVAVEESLYILQIGSFRQHQEADRVKAELALIGIQTEIQRVVIDGGDIWHRVRSGPYKDPAELNQARSRLQENNIEFMLLQLKRDDA